MPSRAEAASKRRPMLLVSGLLMPRSTICSVTSRIVGSSLPSAVVAPGWSSKSAA